MRGTPHSRPFPGRRRTIALAERPRSTCWLHPATQGSEARPRAKVDLWYPADVAAAPRKIPGTGRPNAAPRRRSNPWQGRARRGACRGRFPAWCRLPWLRQTSHRLSWLTEISEEGYVVAAFSRKTADPDRRSWWSPCYASVDHRVRNTDAAAHVEGEGRVDPRHGVVGY